jgi:hypothetical protein
MSANKKSGNAAAANNEPTKAQDSNNNLIDISVKGKEKGRLMQKMMVPFFQ